jgi:hypothetical protein
MTKMIWTSPETKAQIEVVIVSAYEDSEPKFLVHKATATSSKYVFGVRARDCRPA